MVWVLNSWCRGLIFLGEPMWDWCCVKSCGGCFLGEDFGFLDEPV